MPFCFVVMPITTRSADVETYGGDADHFRHVLDHLFRPAVEAAGFEVVSPIAEGADLIHAEIVRNLETADLVLCDVSTLNPNVFFELGIRVALDRPVAIVRDSVTPEIPFDAAVINVHRYDAKLSPWTIDGEIERLRLHVETTATRSDGRNALWRYFGLTQRGETPEIVDPIAGKLDILLSELSALRRERRQLDPGTNVDEPNDGASSTESAGRKFVTDAMSYTGAKTARHTQIGNRIRLGLSNLGEPRLKLDKATRAALHEMAASYGLELTLLPHADLRRDTDADADI